MQDEDDPLVGVEPPEAALELVAIGELDDGIGRRRFRRREVDVGDVHLDGPAMPPAADLPVAGANEEPVKPGVEAVGITQRRQVAPGGGERLLGRVLGASVVTEDQPGAGVESADRDARQLRERVVIDRHSPLDQVPPHRASQGRYGAFGRTHRVRAARRPHGSRFGARIVGVIP